jgi:predicted RNase H-like nuclease (RuvC/YqgF family)
MRQQFDQALSVSENIEKMMSQSAEAGWEVAQLRAECDDLSRRLQIALQTNQELKLTIEKLKHSTNIPVAFRQHREKMEEALRKRAATERELRGGIRSARVSTSEHFSGGWSLFWQNYRVSAVAPGLLPWGQISPG